MNLNAILRLETGGFTNPLAGARAALSGLKNTMTSVLGPLAAVTAGLAGVATVGALFKKSIEAAADDESLHAKLTVLVKSASKAHELLGDLNKFSEVTPFQPEPVQRAGVALLGAKFAAQDMMGVLRDMGDLAAGHMGDLGENLNMVTEAFARMKSGGAGEAMRVLREFSISELDLKGKGLQIDKNGEFKGSAEKAIDAVRAVIKERFGGTMATMAQTTQGLWSTLQGNVTAVLREFGMPMLEPLKQALNSAIGYADVLKAKAKEWGQALADAAMIGVKLFEAGKLGEFAGLSLKVAFADAINYLTNALGKGLSVVGAQGPSFFQTLGDFFDGVAQQFVGTIEKGLAKSLRDLTVGGVRLTNDTDLNSLNMAGNRDLDEGRDHVTTAIKGMAPVLGKPITDFLNGLNTETGEARTKRDELVGQARAALDQARATAAANVPHFNKEDATTTAASEALKGGAKLEDGDRLTKIGLLVGANQSTLQDSARRTATNTERTAAYVLQLINTFGRVVNDRDPLPGVWAAA